MNAYRVNCYREGVLASFGVSEWHETLASALDALLDHQQRSWSSVALAPQARQWSLEAIDAFLDSLPDEQLPEEQIEQVMAYVQKHIEQEERRDGQAQA